MFEHSELKEYDEITNKQVRYNGGIYNFNEYAKMSIDPTRKGKDKIACPIFKTVDEFDNLEFMVDVIFKGKAMDEVYDDIITKIVLHNINYVILENNIDTSLKTVLEDRLKQYNIRNGTNYVCEFEEEYSTARKKTRIKDESYLIKTQMVFPARGTYSPNSELGQFMDNVTRYSDLIPNKNDDAPDSLAIYANKVMRVRHKSEATATVHSINILYS